MPTINRYRRAPKIKNGRSYGTFDPCYIVYNAAVTGRLTCITHTLVEGERLDILAGQHLGDGRLWWVISAASGIGWNLQVPPGTFLRIPVNNQQVAALIG